MTGPDLQNVRTTCGLSRLWLAEHVGMTIEMLGSCEASGGTVPAHVSEKVRAIDRHLTIQAKNIYAHAVQTFAAAPSDQAIDLMDYDSESLLWQALPSIEGVPLAAYRAMLQIVRDAISENLGARTALAYPK